METEQYKTIPFAPKYAVSNRGNVMNLKTKKILKNRLKRDGYIDTILISNDSYKSYLLHRLVAICFIDNPFNYKQVNHINGIKTDNNLNNLEWCSHEQNIKHAIKTGLFNKVGENHPRAKLNNNQVKEIKTYLNKKVKHRILAEQFGVSIKTISEINTGAKWSHITI